jgi:hypothetical protein
VPEFSKHAREKMAARGISDQDVEMALRHPIGPPYAAQPGSLWIRGHAVGGRILKVCVRATDHNYVITAAWPSPNQ